MCVQILVWIFCIFKFVFHVLFYLIKHHFQKGVLKIAKLLNFSPHSSKTLNKLSCGIQGHGVYFVLFLQGKWWKFMFRLPYFSRGFTRSSSELHSVFSFSPDFEDIVTCRVVYLGRAVLNMHQSHRYGMTSSFLNQKILSDLSPRYNAFL